MTGGDYAVTAARRAVASPGRRGLRCRAGAAARGCARRCWTAGASRPRFGRRRQPPPWPHWAAAPTSCSAQDNPDERTPIARSTPARRSSSARASARMSLSTHWAEGRRSSPAFARRARSTWPDCGGLDVVKFFPAEAAGGAATSRRWRLRTSSCASSPRAVSMPPSSRRMSRFRRCLRWRQLDGASRPHRGGDLAAIAKRTGEAVALSRRFRLPWSPSSGDAPLAAARRLPALVHHGRDFAAVDLGDRLHSQTPRLREGAGNPIRRLSRRGLVLVNETSEQLSAANAGSADQPQSGAFPFIRTSAVARRGQDGAVHTSMARTPHSCPPSQCAFTLRDHHAVCCLWVARRGCLANPRCNHQTAVTQHRPAPSNMYAAVCVRRRNARVDRVGVAAGKRALCELRAFSGCQCSRRAP